MNSPASRFPLVLAGWFVSGAVAFAHPGHDDGHELTWDFDHLAAHPVATLLCVAVLAVAIGAVVGAVRRRQRAPQPPVSRD
jgi:urease accessory protein